MSQDSMPQHPLKSVHSLIKWDANTGTLPKEAIQCQGWIRSKRESKGGFAFLTLNDGSSLDSIQIIADQTLENYDSEIKLLTTGCSVIIVGTLTESAGKEQSIEIVAQSVQVLGWIDDPQKYPIAKKRHTFEYLREVAHLRPRTNSFGAITRIRNTAAFAVHQFFQDKNFFWVNTPIITGSDCEGAGELFKVSTLDYCNMPKNRDGSIDYSQDFFGSEAHLTVSGQLQAESYCLAMSKVYTFGPTFRAENSNTSRHLAEFWMVEPEIAFADLNDVVTLAEQFLKSVTQQVLNQCEDDLAFFNQRIDKQCLARIKALVDSDFERIDYSEAIDLLLKSDKTFEYPVKWGLDLQSEHERYLTEEIFKRPVAVLNYPAAIKAFYMRENDNADPKKATCAAMDILAPGIGEIIGGSQREERLEYLDRKMAHHPGLADQLNWYRELRQYGTVPHGGFGLGFERLLNYLTGMDNIRDVIPFPRTPNNVAF